MNKKIDDVNCVIDVDTMYSLHIAVPNFHSFRCIVVIKNGMPIKKHSSAIAKFKMYLKDGGMRELLIEKTYTCHLIGQSNSIQVSNIENFISYWMLCKRNNIHQLISLSLLNRCPFAIV